MELLEDDSLRTYSNLKASADFCLECGDLLNPPLGSEYLECYKCGFKVSLLDYKFEEIVTVKVFTEKKPWLEKYNDKIERGMEEEDEEVEEVKNQQPTIDQECPKCGHKKMYYTSRQMRSADEGETVIYECVKCSHTFSINS